MMTGFGMGFFGWISLVLIILTVVGIATLTIWFVTKLTENKASTSSDGGAQNKQDWREILKARYARGEITQEQYEAMRKSLQT